MPRRRRRKNSNAQKDKTKDQATKIDHVEETQNKKVYKSGCINDDSCEIEPVLSTRNNDTKRMYEFKWLGHVETTWVPYKNLLGASHGGCGYCLLILYFFMLRRSLL